MQHWPTPRLEDHPKGHPISVWEVVTFPGPTQSKPTTLRIVLVHKIHEIFLECVIVLEQLSVIIIICYLMEIVPQLQMTDSLYAFNLENGDDKINVHRKNIF